MSKKFNDAVTDRPLAVAATIGSLVVRTGNARKRFSVAIGFLVLVSAVRAASAQTCTLPPVVITTPPSICASSLSVASVSDAGSGATYAWAIAGGTISAGASTPRVIFRSGSGATTQLTVTVTTAGGCSNAVASVTVNALPSGTITMVDTACPGSTGITASVPNAGSGASYSWTIANGTITSGLNSSAVTFSSGLAGPTALYATVTNASGCSVSRTRRLYPPTSQPFPAAGSQPAGIAVSERSFAAGGGAGVARIATTCPWSASSNAPWLRLTSPATGSGDGMVAFTVDSNSSSAGRAATLTVAGVALSINQRSVPKRDGNSLILTTVAGQDPVAGYVDAQGVAARFAGPIGICFDASGNAYVADRANHVIRKIDSVGNVTTLAGSPGNPGYADGAAGAARFANPSYVAIDAAGNVYVSEGSFGVLPTAGSTIRKVSPAGVVTTLAGRPGIIGSSDGPSSSATFNHPQGLALDNQGNLYVADSGNYTVRRIAVNGTVSTLAGTAGNYNYADGTGASAAFRQPEGLTFSRLDGNLYLSDENSRTIRRITLSGVVTTFAGAADVRGNTDGTGTAARFAGVFDLASDAAGNLYAADTFNSSVRKITPGAVVTTIAAPPSISSASGIGSLADGTLLLVSSGSIRKINTTGGVTAFAGPDLPDPNASRDATARAAYLGSGQLALDSQGSVFLAEGNAIRKMDASGVVTTVAGIATVAGSTDGPAGSALFRGAYGIAVDSSGTIYVADGGNGTIRKIANGVVSTLAGVPGVFGWVDGTRAGALFISPSSLTIDASGNLYVADGSSTSTGAAVRRVTPEGVVTTLAGNPQRLGMSDGQGAAATFSALGGIAFDGSANLFVSDAGTVNNSASNVAIRKVTLGGNVTTLAGNPLLLGSSDGQGTEVRLRSAGHLTVDRFGNVFIPDSSMATIRKIAPDGTTSTVAGTAEVLGSVDGTGASAKLNNPQAVVADAKGRFFISDGVTIRFGIPNYANGDANGDSSVTVSDIFYLITGLFAGGPDAVAGDANGDGSITVADIFYLINYLFANGPAPLMTTVEKKADVTAAPSGNDDPQLELSVGSATARRQDRIAVPIYARGPVTAIAFRVTAASPRIRRLTARREVSIPNDAVRFEATPATGDSASYVGVFRDAVRRSGPIAYVDVELAPGEKLLEPLVLTIEPTTAAIETVPGRCATRATGTLRLVPGTIYPPGPTHAHDAIAAGSSAPGNERRR